jgi:hypothetical protein
VHAELIDRIHQGVLGVEVVLRGGVVPLSRCSPDLPQRYAADTPLGKKALRRENQPFARRLRHVPFQKELTQSQGEIKSPHSVGSGTLFGFDGGRLAVIRRAGTRRVAGARRQNCNGNGNIEVSELVAAVNNLLRGCPNREDRR